MKPDWDKLMDAYADSKTQMVGDVDCTAEGKPLCDAQGVRGFPSLKWGDPNNLEDYQGGRDFATLKKFADDNLKPMCSPDNLDLCEEDKKKAIEEYLKLSASDLDSKIAAEEEKMEKAEEDFKSAVEKLQAEYQKLSDEKDARLEEVKNSGLGLMKSVKASMDKKSGGSDEL